MHSDEGLSEVQVSESLSEGSQQITLTAEEYMHLRQQLGENFDGNMVSGIFIKLVSSGGEHFLH